MFSFSPQQDAAYAIGWPHLRVIDRAGDDAREVVHAKEILGSVDPPWISGRSRAMCLAYVRGVDVTPRGDASTAAIARGTPLDEDEIDALLGRWLQGHRYWFQIEELVLALEALIGSDAAGARLVARIERAVVPPPGELGILFGNAQTVPAHAALFCLGFVALRSPATRAALEALRADGHAARPILDLVLDGAEGCRRHHVRHLFGAIFAGDDPRYLASLSATERFHSSLTPRFPYLGGEEVLRHYVARMRRGVPPWAAERVIAQFGTIRHPLVIELVGALAAQERSRAAALAWLRAHRDLVDAHPAARATLPDTIRAELDGWAPGTASPILVRDMSENEQFVKDLFTRTETAVRAVRGDASKEAEILTAALRELMQQLPDAKGPHIFSSEGFGKVLPLFDTLEPSDEELDRWSDVLLDAWEV